ncbi:hypothetical protein KEH51_23505 [[Brevibacterium] frigoritolerans]|uniref:Uncharacterized protein n=1 Tax=Peribacillus frigoritolerans TaxID=450367 RepID=A0A941FJI1_9BACI|nr:hypothetical protein [Peribacillus frigoritolerans]
MAVIAQQIYFRYFNGQTSDERFSNMNQAVANLMQYAFYYSGVYYHGKDSPSFNLGCVKQQVC